MSRADHGTHARYTVGHCRCWPCRKAHYEYNTHRDKQIAYGRWQKFVPAAPVREHVRSLMSAGIGWRRIAMFAGVNQQTINRLLWSKPPTKKIRTEIADKIMALQPSLDKVGCTTAIDGTGTRRRLQALIALGWSQSKLGARMGITGSNVSRILTSERVTAKSAIAVRDLYESMWNEAPPEEDWRHKIAANRARGYAAERGWVPPMAWDDESIDDPDASPCDTARPRHRKLPSGEELQWLHVELRETIPALAQRFGVYESSIRKALERAA